MKRVLLVTSVLVLIACDPAADLPKNGAKMAGAEGTTEPIDPHLASATVGRPSMVAASEGAQIQVPGVTITRNSADYVEVLRCAKSFVPYAPNGKDARQIDRSVSSWRDNLRYAFAEAKADMVKCRIVGDHIITESMRDLAAPSGEYYYIINPCILKERTTRSNEFCSYNLVFTESIRYENTLSGIFIDTAGDLAVAEGVLAATFSRLHRRAEMMQKYKDVCDLNYFTVRTNNQILKAVLNVAMTGLQMAAGAFLGGVGGPIAATFLGNLRDAFMTTPDPLWQCPEFENELAMGQADYRLVEPQLKAVIDASAKLQTINAGYAKLDAAILQYVQKPAQ